MRTVRRRAEQLIAEAGEYAGTKSMLTTPKKKTTTNTAEGSNKKSSKLGMCSCTFHWLIFAYSNLGVISGRVTKTTGRKATKSDQESPVKSEPNEQHDDFGCGDEPKLEQDGFTPPPANAPMDYFWGLLKESPFKYAPLVLTLLGDLKMIRSNTNWGLQGLKFYLSWRICFLALAFCW